MITLTFRWHTQVGAVDIEVFWEGGAIACVIARWEGKPIELTYDEMVAVRKIAAELIRV